MRAPQIAGKNIKMRHWSIEWLRCFSPPSAKSVFISILFLSKRTGFAFASKPESASAHYTWIFNGNSQFALAVLIWSERSRFYGLLKNFSCLSGCWGWLYGDIFMIFRVASLATGARLPFPPFRWLSRTSGVTQQPDAPDFSGKTAKCTGQL